MRFLRYVFAFFRVVVHVLLLFSPRDIPFIVKEPCLRLRQGHGALLIFALVLVVETVVLEIVEVNYLLWLLRFRSQVEGHFFFFGWGSYGSYRISQQVEVVILVADHEHQGLVLQLEEGRPLEGCRVMGDARFHLAVVAVERFRNKVRHITLGIPASLHHRSNRRLQD